MTFTLNEMAIAFFLGAGFVLWLYCFTSEGRG